MACCSAIRVLTICIAASTAAFIVACAPRSAVAPGASSAQVDGQTSCANPERTLVVDPIELIGGRTVQGRPDLASTVEGVTYWFATAQNKSMFDAQPARYAVADGGACGRMGPLSGIGDARRYAVHDGRIYFFASDGCRATFIKNPAACLELDDALPMGTAEQSAAGRAAMDAFVTWAGGAEELRALTSYRQVATRTEISGGTEYTVIKTVAMKFPDAFMEKESWNESWFSTVRTKEGATMASTRRAERVGSTRAHAFDRQMARHPLVILKAYLKSTSVKSGPRPTEFAAVADGEGTVNGVRVTFVSVWLNGALSRLAVDTATGAPVQISFRGRDAGPSIGDVVWTYTAFRTVDGVQLPCERMNAFNGKPSSPAKSHYERTEINPALPADVFALSPA